MPTISIIIPSWNSAEKLTKNLQSSLDAIKGYPGSEVIVVDDASSDNSVEVVEKQFPEVRLIKRPKNGGFSSTVNHGVREAKGEFVVQINSDARPEKDFLKYALPHFKNPQVFSINCNSGGSWNTAEFKNGYIWHKQAPGDPNQVHQTLWSSGGSGIFRRDLWQKMGGLDELFNPFYEEDMDLGYRATKRGYINIWEPKCKVEHYKEKGVIATHFSTSKVARVAQRNQLFFMWKNITDSGMLFRHILALAMMLLTHPKYWRIFLSALVKLPQLLPKRAEEQKHARLTDKQVLEMLS